MFLEAQINVIDHQNIKSTQTSLKLRKYAPLANGIIYNNIKLHDKENICRTK